MGYKEKYDEWLQNLDSNDSLYKELLNITEDEYHQILQSTLEISKKLRSGYFTKTVMKKI